MRSIVVAAALIAIAPDLPAQDTGWTIDRFDVRFNVREDRSVDVVERIDVDFGSLRRHGIYRDIPVRYQRLAGSGFRAGRTTIDIDLHGVEDGRGNARRTKVDRSGNDLRIRIGDPDRTVTGPQTYEIRYRIASALGFFDEHDELYWQVTGTGWPVPIGRATASVTVPAATSGAATGPWEAWCYAGWAGSTSDERCTAEYRGSGRYAYSAGRLEPGEGLTLVAMFPKGVVAPPPLSEKVSNWLLRYGPGFLPLGVIALMTLLWRRRGREPDVGSVVPVWDVPADVPPGPAGALYDQKSDMRDIVAALIDLARRGYLQIDEVAPDTVLGAVDEGSFTARVLKTLGISTTDWRLTRLRSDTSDLPLYDRLIIDGIFENDTTRRMSDLHNEFYTHVTGIHEAIYDELVDRGFFLSSPHSTRLRYRWLGIGIAATGVGLGIFLSHTVLLVAMILSGVVIVAFANAMPATTLLGARRRRHLAGLEEYIRRAEKAELEYRQAPEKTPELFETILPYAIALDVSDIWASQFEAILASSPPEWYTGSPGTWSDGQFGNRLSGFETAAVRTMGSAPGSSSGGGGGGSVGGGGGGGGGGSW